MPELPNLSNYINAISERTLGEPVTCIRLSSPFVLRSVTPAVEDLVGKKVRSVSRLGKRIVFGLEEDFFIVIHLMIAGRFRWYSAGAKILGKLGLIAFDFSAGTLVLTEAGQKHQVSVHLVHSKTSLQAFEPGGTEVFEIDFEQFKERLIAEKHTIKRSLTDPHFLSGISNVYSDEILHHARISPLRQTRLFTEEQWQHLRQP